MQGGERPGRTPATVRAMALVYDAQLNPTKIELISRWLADQQWFSGDAESAEALGAYRFDDPAGEVGIETHLVRAGDGPTYQVPLSYRPAELPGAEDFLLGTLDHSVLGKRWIYDATADPVYADQLARAILGGGTEAAAFTPDGDPIEPTLTVQGSGTAADVAPAAGGSVTSSTTGRVTTITAGGVRLEVLRVLDGVDTGGSARDREVLVGTYADGTAAGSLAFATKG